MAQIRSEMPATVWQIRVAVGERIEEGHEVIILESMKMEIPVVAHVGGVVVTIHVGETDVVQEGDLLVELG
jgi:acetyl-CoA carboxylase biotin carboxyl carrier protein